tara:strand:+ start:333 stop:482 length:150 start_codon:yes stop_codon:yes gene_type:complete
MTPEQFKDHMVEQLENLNFTGEQLIISFVKFLPQSQLEELKDSIDREMF